MGKGWKVLIGIAVLLALLLGLNALTVDSETKGAEVTIPGARILKLQGGEVQVLEKGPRRAAPIVLLHCFTCAIDWWDGMIPPLARRHRVIAIDLLGFGGSAKPGSGYSMESQGALVSEALARLDVRRATVVGHSMGGAVATELAEEAPQLVARLVLVDQAPDNSYGPGLPFPASLSFDPVIGEAIWRLVPDSQIREGLSKAFAPGYDVPDRFVEDFHRMTYTSYDASSEGEDAYEGAEPLDRRIEATGVPLLAIFGAQDQIYDARRSLAAYARVPGARTALVTGAGHSPNVEKPARTAALVLAFANRPAHSQPPPVQEAVQKRNPVRRRS